MDENTLIEQIGNLIDEKLDKKLLPLKEQLNTVEMKVEAVNQKVDQVEMRLNEKIEHVEKRLTKKIEQSQQDMIETLTELINTGYSIHEERIKKLEKRASVS